MNTAGEFVDFINGIAINLPPTSSVYAMLVALVEMLPQVPTSHFQWLQKHFLGLMMSTEAIISRKHVCEVLCQTIALATRNTLAPGLCDDDSAKLALPPKEVEAFLHFTRRLFKVIAPKDTKSLQLNAHEHAALLGNGGTTTSITQQLPSIQTDKIICVPIDWGWTECLVLSTNYSGIVAVQPVAVSGKDRRCATLMLNDDGTILGPIHLPASGFFAFELNDATLAYYFEKHLKDIIG